VTAIPAHTLDVLARAVLGAPDAKASTATKLRFGRYSLDLAKGRLYDFEEEATVAIETVVAREKGLSDEDAIRWVNDHLDPKPNGANGHHEEPADLPEEIADERALIGLILLKPDVLKFAEEEVAATDFLSDLHAAVFAIFLDARENDYRANIENVVGALAGEGHRAPSGYTIAQYVARLAASAPFGGDEAADDTARRLARQIRQFAEVERGKEPEPESTAPEPFKSTFSAYTWGDARHGRAAYEYVIKGIVPRGESVLIYGASQSGKSFFTFDLAMAVARGIPFAGRRTKAGLVVYCAAEAGVGFIDLRMPAYERHHGLAPGRLPFVCLPRKFDLFGGETELIELIGEIKGHAAQFDLPLAAVVIDTLNKTTPGMDEIHGKDVGIVMSRLERIQVECQTGLWLVHHKNGAGTGPRGHTSLYAGFETAIEISRAMSEKDEADRPIRFARLAKQREGEDGIVWRFVLPSVEVGRDAEGDPMTSCVVAPPAGQATIAEKPSAARGGVKRPSPQQSNILRALLKALSEHGEATPGALQLPRSVTTVTRVGHWYDAYRQTAAEQTDDAVKQAMKRASDFWLERRVIGRNNPYVWITGRPVEGVIKGTEDQGAPQLPEQRDPPTDEMVDPFEPTR
jgi:hypothetical protein